MKVLLLQSYLGGSEPPVFPLGLACVKAQISNHEVLGFDTNTSKRPLEELKEVVEAFSPDAIGISLRNIDSTNKREVVFYYAFLKKAIDVIKKSSKAKIIVGGSGFSMFAKEIMADDPRIDYGVFLEGERTVQALLDNISAPEGVKGIFYRKDGDVIFSGAGEPIDLNNVGLPDWGFIPVGNYKDVPEAIGIETKRGCALKCVYCIYGFLNGKEYRLRDTKRIVDDIEHLLKDKGIENFTFVDSVFNIPLRHAEDICHEIIRRGLSVTWSAWFSESGLKKEFVELVKAAGCKKIILSPDGYSGKVLKALKKNITKKDILKSYEVLKRIDGYEICYNFFKNPPGQSLAAFLSLLFFCVKAKIQMGKRVHFEFNSLRIEPHTALYDIAVSEGVVRSGDDVLHPVYYTQKMTSYIEDFLNMVLKLSGK
jgi:anaerobic magnesium-protoporphyrin IX monomethyl ester cyclase